MSKTLMHHRAAAGRLQQQWLYESTANIFIKVACIILCAHHTLNLHLHQHSDNFNNKCRHKASTLLTSASSLHKYLESLWLKQYQHLAFIFFIYLFFCHLNISECFRGRQKNLRALLTFCSSSESFCIYLCSSEVPD